MRRALISKRNQVGVGAYRRGLPGEFIYCQMLIILGCWRILPIYFPIYSCIVKSDSLIKSGKLIELVNLIQGRLNQISITKSTLNLVSHAVANK